MGTILKVTVGIFLAFFIIIIIVIAAGSKAYNADKERQIREAEEYTARSYASNNYSYTECRWSDSQGKIVCSYAVKYYSLPL